MGKKKKVVELLLDPDKDIGIEAVSLVTFPAIEENFMAFSQDFYTMAQMDAERRIVTGPALIPNKRIPRIDQSTGEEFDIIFPEETVRNAMMLYMKHNRLHNATEQHEFAINGCYAVECWMKEYDQDKADALGYKLPTGAWMLSMFIGNNDVWNGVKDGTLRGFSIEGFFAERLMKEQMKSSITKGKELTEDDVAEAIIKILNAEM